MISEISICNSALGYLGGESISSLTQENRGAQLCSRYFPESRDALLESHYWNFATRYVALPQIVEAPLFGYAHAYRLPQDCLRVQRIFSALYVGNASAYQGAFSTGMAGFFCPPAAFEVVEDGVLYCNIQPAYAIISTRVTDCTRYSALFANALARQLAADMAHPFTGSKSLAQHLQKEAHLALENAIFADVKEGQMHHTPEDAQADSWLQARCL